jgi:hypothetical protein
MSRRTTVVLGLVAAATVAAAIAVTFVGRSGESAQHRQVVAYIGNVNAAQGSLSYQMLRVTSAFRLFSSGNGGPATIQRLGQAERTLRRVHARVAGVPAPAPATKLRTLLLRLVHDEVAIADELGRVAAFLPDFGKEVAASRAAAKQLGSNLAAVPHPQTQTVRGTAKQIAAAKARYAADAAAAATAEADAIDAYDGALARVVAGLRRLHAPAVLAPLYRSQLTSLVATRTAAAALAAELRTVKRSRVPALNRRFVEATRSSKSVDAQTAQIAAVKAYNARVRAAQQVQRLIATELQRLQAFVR